MAVAFAISLQFPLWVSIQALPDELPSGLVSTDGLIPACKFESS